MKTLPLLPIVCLCAGLYGCSAYDWVRLAAPPNTSVLIKQNRPNNAVTFKRAGPIYTDLTGIKAYPERLPVTPSQSLATPTGAMPRPSAEFLQNATLAQAQKTLIQYADWVETHPDTAETCFAPAEALAARFPEDGLVQQLFQRLSRFTDWQPVNAIINNAGIDFVSLNGWQPENPFIRVRRALLPPVADNEHVIFADQRLVLLMTNTAPVALHMDARLEDVPFLPETPSRLLYQVDDGAVKPIDLADKADWQRFTVNIAAGGHTVRLYQQQPVGNQYVKLRFDDHLSNLSVAQERPYFISTAATPLEFYSQGPAVLRIDELKAEGISYRYQHVPEGWQKISLPPSLGQARSLLRVSQRVTNLQAKPLQNRLVTRELLAVPKPDVATQPLAQAETVELTDAFKLGKQEDGTLSLGVDVVRRNNKQESGALLNEEQFGQYRLNYRYFDEPHDSYWNSQGLFRLREYGGPTLGINKSVYYNPDGLPFNVRSTAKLFAQVPHDELEALAQWDLAIAQAYDVHPKTRLIPSVSFFARSMTLQHSLLPRNDAEYQLKVDQDVFTPYKADHTTGLTPALALEHRPWLDTVWSAKAAAAANENLDFTESDHYRTEAHWQQLLGSVVLDASYRTAFYQPDADRLTAIQRSYAEVECNWQHWSSHQNRFEIGAQYSYDIERNAHLATLSLTLHLGEGRGLRDFAPNEIDFRDHRQRQFVGGDNNTLRDAIFPGSKPVPLN